MINNGSTYTIGGFTPAGNIRLKENGWVIGAMPGISDTGCGTSFGGCKGGAPSIG